VDITGGLIEILKSLYLQRKKEGLEMGVRAPIEIIFHREGENIQQKFMRRKFNQILKTAGLRKIRFHDIRHTYASKMISRGANIKYVSEQLGHSSIDITLDIYAKYMPQGDRSEVNLLEKNSASPHPTRTHKKMKG
jgi:integrase